MSEKRGDTGKLIYDFNECWLTEVQNKEGRWYRTTCRMFRSWDGPRRIKESTNMYEYDTTQFQEYNGPLFMYNTNLEVEPDGRCDIRWEPGYIHTQSLHRHRK